MKVLLAMTDQTELSVLRSILESEETRDMEVAGVTGSGMEACRLIEEQKPDLVLMNMVLPELDAIGIMEALKKRGIGLPNIIIVSYIRDNVMVNAALQAGARYYMTKPYERGVLFSRMRMLCEQERQDNAGYGSDGEKRKSWNGKTLRKSVDAVLTQVGVPKLSGYQYLQDAIVEYIQDGSYNRYRIKDLLVKVGNKYHVSSDAVERAIRYALSKTMSEGNPEELIRTFRLSGSGQIKLSPGRFIYMVAELFEETEEKEVAD